MQTAEYKDLYDHMRSQLVDISFENPIEPNIDIGEQILDRYRNFPTQDHAQSLEELVQLELGHLYLDYRVTFAKLKMVRSSMAVLLSAGDLLKLIQRASEAHRLQIRLRTLRSIIEDLRPSLRPEAFGSVLQSARVKVENEIWLISSDYSLESFANFIANEETDVYGNLRNLFGSIHQRYELLVDRLQGSRKFPAIPPEWLAKIR